MAEAIYKPIIISGPDREQEATSSSPLKGVDHNAALLALIVALVFIVCSLFNVWAHHQVISLSYEISRASEEEQELLKESKKLRLELAALKSPKRIENEALKDLGFINPQKEQLIIVR
jgi:cell division protein FtsL